MKRVQLEIVLGTIFVFLSGALLVVMGFEEPARLARFENMQRAESIEFGASVYEVNCTNCHGTYAQGVEGKAPCLRCRELFAPIAITIDGTVYEVNFDSEITSDVAEGRNVRVEYSEGATQRVAILVELSDDATSDTGTVAVGLVSNYKDRIGTIGWQGSLEDYIISIVTTGRQISTRPQYFGGGSPAMPTWGDKYGGPLRVDQVAAVSAFIMNFETWALQPDLIPFPQAPGAESDDPILRGRAAFASLPCAACHTIDGFTAGVGGPVLDGLASRAADSVDGLSAEEYIRESILNPSAYVVEGFPDGLMPADFAEVLTDEQIENLLAYLLTLTE